jgi:hypothetical protein
MVPTIATRRPVLMRRSIASMPQLLVGEMRLVCAEPLGLPLNASEVLALHPRSPAGWQCRTVPWFISPPRGFARRAVSIR